jgi:hypothetical protein
MPASSTAFAAGIRQSQKNGVRKMMDDEVLRCLLFKVDFHNRPVPERASKIANWLVASREVLKMALCE